MGNCAGLATRRVIIQPGGARGPHTAPGAPIPCRSGALGGCGVRLARELARAKHQSSRREHSKCPPSTPLTKADHQARLGFATQRSGSYRTALSLLAVKLNVLSTDAGARQGLEMAGEWSLDPPDASPRLRERDGTRQTAGITQTHRRNVLLRGNGGQLKPV